MIGAGRFRALTCDFTSSGVPYADAAALFSSALQRRTGCRLAWHRSRRVFVVFRSRGDHCNPKSFFDIGLGDLPFNSGLLGWACMTIAFYEAQAGADPDRAMRISRQFADERLEREINGFVDDRTPEFTRDMRRIQEIVTDGRVRQKHFDMGATAA